MNTIKLPQAISCVRRVNGRFENHVCSRYQGTDYLKTRTEMMVETSLYSLLNHLTQLLALEMFTVFIVANFTI